MKDVDYRWCAVPCCATCEHAKQLRAGPKCLKQEVGGHNPTVSAFAVCWLYERANEPVIFFGD